VGAGGAFGGGGDARRPGNSPSGNAICRIERGGFEIAVVTRFWAWREAPDRRPSAIKGRRNDFMFIR